MHAFDYIAPDGSEWSVDVDRNGPYLAIEATRAGGGLPITETVDTALPEMIGRAPSAPSCAKSMNGWLMQWYEVVMLTAIATPLGMLLWKAIVNVVRAARGDPTEPVPGTIEDHD